MKTLSKLGKSLTRNEMKNVSGGSNPGTATCSGPCGAVIGVCLSTACKCVFVPRLFIGTCVNA